MGTFAREMNKITAKLSGAAGGSSRSSATMAKSLRSTAVPTTGATLTGEQFLAKALAMNAAGKLSAAEVSQCEFAIARGEYPAAELVKAVFLGTDPGLRGEHGAAFRQLQRNLNIAPLAKGGDVHHTRAPSGRMAPSEQPLIGDTITGDQFLIRAEAARANKVIDSKDVAVIEQCVNAGKQPPAHLVRAVFSGEEYPAWLKR